MPTIGNTSLPYYSQNTAVNLTKPPQSQALQKVSEPITVLKADPPPSVELTKPPALDLKADPPSSVELDKPSSLDLDAEIQKSQGIDLSKLETPAPKPTSISSLNTAELQELKSLDSSGTDASNSDAISQLKASLTQSSITSL